MAPRWGELGPVSLSLKIFSEAAISAYQQNWIFSFFCVCLLIRHDWKRICRRILSISTQAGSLRVQHCQRKSIHCQHQGWKRQNNFPKFDVDLHVSFSFWHIQSLLVFNLALDTVPSRLSYSFINGTEARKIDNICESFICFAFFLHLITQGINVATFIDRACWSRMSLRDLVEQKASKRFFANFTHYS